MSAIAEKSGKRNRIGHLSHDLGVYVGKKYYSHKKKVSERPKPEIPTEEEFYKLYDPYDTFGPFGPYWG